MDSWNGLWRVVFKKNNRVYKTEFSYVNFIRSFYSTLFAFMFPYYFSGFGSGAMFIIGSACLNDHFTKMRTVAFGLMHTVNMTIATLLPLLLNVLIETYGSQGSQLLLSAIAANTIPASLLLRTAKRSSKYSQNYIYWYWNLSENVFYFCNTFF